MTTLKVTIQLTGETIENEPLENETLEFMSNVIGMQKEEGCTQIALNPAIFNNLRYKLGFDDSIDAVTIYKYKDCSEIEIASDDKGLMFDVSWCKASFDDWL